MLSALPLWINECSALYSIHGFADEEIDEKHMIDRSNFLQVTLQGRAIIYDLRKDNPTAVTEIPAM